MWRSAGPTCPRSQPGYIRKQTLVNGERYVTPELKEFEALILGAQEKVEELEQAIYRHLCAQVAGSVVKIHDLAGTLALIDLFSSLAEVASLYGYVRPELSDDGVISIVGGRHPVVERVVGEGVFVPNDLHLTGEEQQIIVLTGPNMSGEIHLHEAGGPDNPDVADRELCPCGERSHRAGGPDFHESRSAGRPLDRSFYIHDRDAGNGEDPSLGDTQVPDYPGRDREGHEHLMTAYPSPRRSLSISITTPGPQPRPSLPPTTTSWSNSPTPFHG